MLICVYGEDGLRAHQKVSQLKKHFKDKFDSIGMNVSEFGAKTSVGEILSATQSGGLLSQKRMVILDGVASSAKKDDIETLSQAFNNTDEDSIVILKEDLSKKDFEKQSLVKKLKEAKDRHDYEFEQLSSRDLERWVVHELQELGVKIERDALEHLIANTSSDTWQLHQEMQKLSSYVGLEGTVLVEHVTKLVHASFEDEIFKFVDAVSQKRTADAVKLLEHERSSGASDGYLLSMLLRQVRILLGARGLLDENGNTRKDEVARELGVHPFVAGKALAQAKRYKSEELISTHDLLFELDQETKGGGMDSGLALEKVVSKMTK